MSPIFPIIAPTFSQPLRRAANNLSFFASGTELYPAPDRPVQTQKSPAIEKPLGRALLLAWVLRSYTVAFLGAAFFATAFFAAAFFAGAFFAAAFLAGAFLAAAFFAGAFFAAAFLAGAFFAAAFFAAAFFAGAFFTAAFLAGAFFAAFLTANGLPLLLGLLARLLAAAF